MFTRTNQANNVIKIFIIWLIIVGKKSNNSFVLKSAEEKILYEAESLSLMCFAHNYSQGIIVLCGGGWSPVKYLWFLSEYNPPSNVKIISYDTFRSEYLGAVYA